MTHGKRKPPPLDAAGIDRLALRYVERFATTRGRLAQYLARKIYERGWDGPIVDPASVAERLAALGYIDDRAFADAKARSMGRRGLGARRIVGALRSYGVGAEETEQIAPDLAKHAAEAALALARRRHIGPFAIEPADRAGRERQLGIMLRAGHDLTLARRIVQMRPGDEIDPLLND